ncbi:protein kinase family protein [Helicovermis profundi]|uniref:Protein kinase domain-containing protein n=1 Tax=Helicovermis profundi TaxID=3065157 RepID=A0AAU9E465_9FIRM|nr:hypothetical protein HLPR_15290 [Clostridia bacterium S502]
MDRLKYIEQKLLEWNNSIELSNKDLYSTNYEAIENLIMKELFSVYHSLLFWHFANINSALRNLHYWADPSRDFIHIIDEYENVCRALINTEYEFSITEYYSVVIEKCKLFLDSSGGSPIPEEFEKIVLKEYEAIFSLKNTVRVNDVMKAYELKMIGDGSYANVYKYKDEFYNKTFALKKAKVDLEDKEIIRFKEEFNEMNKLNSPYVLEVYKFNVDDLEYTMEYADITMDKYILSNNDKVKFSQRISFVRQVFKGLDYIHSQGLLHRDISTTNILLKIYHDVEVIKISDFGLVKRKNSNLTSLSTEFKGSLNDPKLAMYGNFKDYKIEHETFALTRLIYFIMTGRKKIKLKPNSTLNEFINKGISDKISERYSSIVEIREAFEQSIVGKWIP